MINCTITSPEKKVQYTNVQSVMLPAFSGKMQILSGHAESFVLLKKGDISLKQSRNRNERIQIIDGECYIKNDFVTIIL